MILGCLNEDLLALVGGEEVAGLEPRGVLPRGRGGGGGTTREGAGVITGVSVPYCKWLIPPPPPHPPRPTMTVGVLEEAEEEKLPPGYTYTYAPLRPSELARVVESTAIPRTAATLAKLQVVGVRWCPGPVPTTSSLAPSPASMATDTATATTTGPAGQLVAWAFLNVDGSLTSLHVEAGHRRRGLATKVAGRLCRLLVGGEGGGMRGDGGEGWVHSDVAVENVESAGVARGLGGVEGWRVRWVSVDLAAVGWEG